ncbi:MAG: DUF2079 domain-containing protein [Thermoplasmata archaeon]
MTIRGVFEYLWSIFKKEYIIISMFVAFAVLWSYIAVLRIYALSETVSGAGMLMQYGSSFTNNPFTFQNLIMHPLIWLLFPLFMIKSYAVLLVFQQMFITIGVFAVYGISRQILKSKVLALMISLSFLVYPYIAGLYWYTLFYQSLFPTLFMIAYYLYLKSWYRSSFIVFIVSGLTMFPYMLFIVLFAIMLIIESLFKRRYESLKYPAILLITAMFLFLIMNYSHPSLYGNLGMYIPRHPAPFLNIDYKVNVLLVLLVPLLALPVLSKRFLIMFIPYFYVLFYLPSPAPFLSYQYAPLVLAFLYLGFIDTLHDLVEDEPSDAKSVRERITHTVSDPKFKFTALMLVLVILFAAVYLPIGPFNQYSEASFEFAESTAANYTAYSELSHIIAMVPANNPYLLTQNNILSAYPRPLAYGAPLITGVSNFTDNLTAQSQYLNMSGKLIPTNIEYVIADLNSPYYLSGTPNMYDFASLYYSSGKYGIVAEAAGFVLLEKGYKGAIRYYEPDNFHFKAASLILGPNTTVHKNVILANNTNNTLLWHTTLFNLAPGTYNITFSVYTNNTALKNDLMINVSAFTVPLLSQYYLSGLALKTKNAWTSITFSLNIYSFFENITLSCYSMHWNGSLEFKNVAITERSALLSFATALPASWMIPDAYYYKFYDLKVH